MPAQADVSHGNEEWTAFKQIQKVLKSLFASTVKFHDSMAIGADKLRRFFAQKRHIASLQFPEAVAGSVNPIADRHTRPRGNGIGTRYAYIPHARAVSHGCPRTRNSRPRAAREVFKSLLGDTS